MHPGGFEPPTARFVAEYSIQLSYGCIGKIYFTADIDIATKAISSKRWCIREDYSPCGSPFGPLLAQRYPSWCLRLIPLPLRYPHCRRFRRICASGRIRTSDRSVRSRVLYPAELRMHREIYFTADIDTATKAVSSKRWCIREDYSPCGSPFGPLLAQRYPPWCLRLIPLPLRYLHRRRFRRIWCIREDSNLRPLGS